MPKKPPRNLLYQASEFSDQTFPNSHRAGKEKQSQKDPQKVADPEQELQTVVFVSACAGSGLTSLLAMTGKALHKRGYACALLDLDLEAGGMDVLLGLEGNPGIRLNEIEAPLGRIDPSALRHELTQWDGISVLSCDPWKGPSPQWWDIHAVIQSLNQSHDVLLVDAGRGGCIENIELLSNQPCVVLVELSILGLARTRILLDRLSSNQVGKHLMSSVQLIGIVPRGLRGSGPVKKEEAEAFLGKSFLVCLRPRPRLASELQAGMGLNRIPWSYHKPLACIVKRLEGLLSLKETGENLHTNQGED